MELNEKLAELRREQGLTQDELASKVGVTRQAVSKWERGVMAPSTVNLIALGRLYGIPLDELANPQQAPATAVAVAEEPEAASPPRPSRPKTAGAVALAAGILLTGVIGGIIISFTVLREPDDPANDVSIIRAEDMEQEDIDLAELLDKSSSWDVIDE